MAKNTNKRIPVKWVRDRAKAAYEKKTQCCVCGSATDLELHHLHSVTILLDKWSEARGYDISQVECQLEVPNGMQMTQELLADSDLMCEMFRSAYVAAESMGDYGLANFLADRQDAHKKHSWMLRSTLK